MDKEVNKNKTVITVNIVYTVTRTTVIRPVNKPVNSS